tara:strand:- start:888 stop:1886 length:999 start_codon:yes stop_codon:yes gene_type:complete
MTNSGRLIPGDKSAGAVKNHGSYIRDEKWNQVYKNPFDFEYRARVNPRVDLTQATFIIPVRIESEDRLRNVVTAISFLIENFNTNIFVKEVDTVSHFQNRALPKIGKLLGIKLDVPGTKGLPRFRFAFEHSDDPLFHRQKILNEMISTLNRETTVTSNVIVNYDADVVLPLESYTLSYKGILDGVFDVVYPYGQGEYQRKVTVNNDQCRKFIFKKDYSILDNNSEVSTSDFGWAQFFRKKTYIEGGMENENFKAYAPEDKERFYRFNTLGYRVGRIDNVVYHLEHARGENSWFTNPHMESNMGEWNKIQQMNKEQLLQYYSEQQYLEKYVSD